MRLQHFVILSIALPALLQANGAQVMGRVYDGNNKEGIPDLTVKLIPPSNVKTPERTTATDSAGEFSFTDTDAGRYLLEVYYGVTIVHREVIVLKSELKMDIPLQRTTTAAQGPLMVQSKGPESNLSREVSVPADRPWTDTEIVVKKGQVISFVATGEVRWGAAADKTAGPDGDRRKLSARLGSTFAYPIRGMGAGGLIARVGKGAPFKIGAKVTATMQNSGELYLGINDNFFSNNSGAFHVTITRSSP